MQPHEHEQMRQRDVTTGDDLLSERETATILGWAIKTLQRRRWQGDPPAFIKLGRTVRYRRSVIEAFIASGERTSTSQAATDAEMAAGA